MGHRKGGSHSVPIKVSGNLVLPFKKHVRVINGTSYVPIPKAYVDAYRLTGEQQFYVEVKR